MSLASTPNDLFTYILRYLIIDEIKQLYETSKLCNKKIDEYIKKCRLQCSICNIISSNSDMCIKCMNILYKKCDNCDYNICGKYYIKQTCFTCDCKINLCRICVENKINKCNICNKMISKNDTYVNEMNIHICFDCLRDQWILHNNIEIRYYTTFTPWNGRIIGEELYRNYDIEEPWIILYNISKKCRKSIILCVQLGYITLEEFYKIYENNSFI